MTNKLALGAMMAVALPVAAGLWAATPQPAPTPSPDDTATRQMIEKTCSGCHEIGQVTNAHKSRDDWAATVDKMVGYGAQLSDADNDKVVAYLAVHQGLAKQ